ncbi:hypothetical protein [Streptomyces lavendulocolor]|uniref:hypothetical protein n=1 Tax=Streptomyces lavendulocolor TaxID=67316 RepID=UPI0033E3B38E
MPLLATLVDDFTDGTLDTASRWSGSYGDLTETGGRAQIPCGTGYAGLKSASAYTLAGSAVHLQIFPADPTGAASAAASVLVLSATGGTDAGFIVDPAQNAVGCYLRSGYADGGAVFLTYSPADHRWLRLREAAGTLYWETSSNGVFWATRRTAASPAWVSETGLAVLVEGHRDAGPETPIEVDNVNAPPGQAVQLTAAAVTEGARPVGLAKVRTLGVAASVIDVPPIGLRKTRTLGVAGATESAQAVGYDLTVSVGAPWSDWEVGEPW